MKTFSKRFLFGRCQYFTIALFSFIYFLLLYDMEKQSKINLKFLLNINNNNNYKNALMLSLNLIFKFCTMHFNLLVIYLSQRFIYINVFKKLQLVIEKKSKLKLNFIFLFFLFRFVRQSKEGTWLGFGFCIKMTFLYLCYFFRKHFLCPIIK